MRGSRKSCQRGPTFFRGERLSKPKMNAGLVAFDFSGDTDQYCYETLYFWVFFKGGVARTLPPL